MQECSFLEDDSLSDDQEMFTMPATGPYLTSKIHECVTYKSH